MRGCGYDREDEPREEDEVVGEQAHGDWWDGGLERRPATDIKQTSCERRI